MARIEQDELGELLSAYVDGELSNDETAVVEKLLREDATARHLLEQLSRTVDATRALPRHPAPASLAGDVQAMLERSALLDDVTHKPIKLHRDRAPWTARLSLAAMVGLVVVGGWYFMQEPTKSRLAGAPMAVPSEKSALSEGVDSTPRESGPPRFGDVAAQADRRTVDEKLAAGVVLASLRTHPFNAEGLRLQVSVRDTKEANALADRLSKRLTDEKLINLETKTGNGSPESAAFYLRGSEGKNFNAPRESQIMVRATPSQLDQILSDVAIIKPSESDTTLVAGPVKVQGIQQSQQVLNATRRSRNAPTQTQTPAPTDKLATGAKKEAPGKDFVTSLVEIIGIDPAVLQKAGEKNDATSVASAEHTEEKDSRSKELADEAGSRRDQPRAEPSGALVERNLARIAEPAAEPEPEPLYTMIIQLVPPPEPTRTARPSEPKPAAQQKPGNSSK